MLPKTSDGNYNYLGYGQTVNQADLMPLPPGEIYNILCNHVIYNRQAFRSIMPNDTIYIGIIRNPVSQFMSGFLYYGVSEIVLSQHQGAFLSDVQLMNLFLTNPQSYDTSNAFYYLQNKMSFDFGLSREYFYNELVVSKFISDLNEDFSLVIILEYIDESLVLMKRILCWELQDILYLALNVNYPKLLYQNAGDTSTLSQNAVHNLERFNNADFLLYDFFHKRFLSQTRNMGDDFKNEVNNFREIRKNVATFCQFPQSTLTVSPTPWNSKFSVSSEDCKNMARDELEFVKEKILQANLKYTKWLESMPNG